MLAHQPVFANTAGEKSKRAECTCNFCLLFEKTCATIETTTPKGDFYAYLTAKTGSFGLSHFGAYSGYWL